MTQPPEPNDDRPRNGPASTQRGRAPQGGLNPSWTICLGRPFGVPIYVSASWLLFLAFITVQFAPVVSGAVPGIGSARYIVAATFGVFLGLSILTHEVAHCVVARMLSIPIERISLSFMSGHSALAEEPRTPGRAAAVAVVGPLANLAIAVGAGAAYVALPSAGIASVLAAGLAWSNAVVGLYNLLPGLPLDGGQLLRALLWRVRGNVRAGTIGASWAGRGIAVLTAVLGVALFAQRSSGLQASALWAILVAGMLWVSSTSVLRQQAVRDRLPKIVAGLLARPAVSVTADLPMAEAVRRAQEAHAQGIVIVDNDGRPSAVVREAQVLATPAARRPWVSIGSVSHQVSAADLIPVAASGETLIRLLQSRAASEYIVVDPDGEVFGVLAAADVARALAGSKQTGVLGYAGTAGPRPDQVAPDNLRA